MRIHRDRIKPNPYRDLVNNPIDEAAVLELVESIHQTDFWDNIMARPAGNELNGMIGKELADYLKTLDEVDFDVEQAYGHRRLEALFRTDIEWIDIPIKVIEDEIMLQIMANENKDTWGHNMAVILETVRQVRNTLHEQVNRYDDFEEYLEHYSFFSVEKDWKTARNIEGIGYRRIHQFLGETWKENDIRNAMGVLRAIDEGVFNQTQIIHMPSVGVMDRYQRLATVIREVDAFPPFFKEHFIQEASNIITDESIGSTVKIVSKATQHTKKGNNPLEYLLKQKIVPFDLAKALYAMVKDEDNEMTLESILETEGLMDFKGIAEAVESVEDMIKKAQEREDAGGSEPPEETPTPDEVEEAITDAEGELEGDLPDIPDLSDADLTLQDLAAGFVQSSDIFSAQVDRLRGTMGDMDEKTSDRFGGAYEKVFSALVVFGLEA